MRSHYTSSNHCTLLTPEPLTHTTCGCSVDAPDHCPDCPTDPAPDIKQLKYRPVAEWLQRVYNAPWLAKLMGSWPERQRTDGVIADIIDGQAFKSLHNSDARCVMALLAYACVTPACSAQGWATALAS